MEKRKSLIGKLDIERTEIEIVEGLVVEISDDIKDIIEASFIAEQATEINKKIEKNKINDESTDEEKIEFMKNLRENFINAENAIYEGIETLLINKDDIEKIKNLKLSFKNLNILFSEIISSAQLADEDEVEEGERFQK